MINHRLIVPAIPRKDKFIKGLNRIWRTKELTTGYYTKKIEEKIKKIHKSKYVILTSSGTTAFQILCMAVKKLNGVKEVDMHDFTWESTKHIAEQIFDKVNYIEDALNNQNLLILNQPFGVLVEPVKPRKNVIYDSAHCFGNSLCNGRGFGEILSFSPAKVISACEGGAILTNNKRVYEKCLELRKYHGRISELNALFLLLNIDNLQTEQKRRLEAWQIYNDNLPGRFIRFTDYLTSGMNIPTELYFQYRGDNYQELKELREFLAQLFPIRQRYKPTNMQNKNCLRAYNYGIIFPIVSKKEILNICNLIKEWLKKR